MSKSVLTHTHTHAHTRTSTYTCIYTRTLMHTHTSNEPTDVHICDYQFAKAAGHMANHKAHVLKNGHVESS